MYVIRARYTVAATRRAGFAEWFDRGQHADRPSGYRGGMLLNSLGAPSSWTVMVYWDARETALDYYGGLGWAKFEETIPTLSVATPVGSNEAHEELRRTGDGADATVATLTDWDLDPGRSNTTSFEDTMAGLVGLRAENSAPAASAHLLRYLGNPTRYLTIETASDYWGLLSHDPSSQAPSFVDAQPWSMFGSHPPTVEFFAIVRRV